MMNKNYFAVHASHAKHMNGQDLREHFLIESIFSPDNIKMSYTHYDRMIVGGAMPVNEKLILEPFDTLKANYFLERRELGIINVGGRGSITIDDEVYILEYLDALYVGRGKKTVVFESTEKLPSLFYLNSVPAHSIYPTKRITLEQAEKAVLGSPETANLRTINKLIIPSSVSTCQLQMGITQLQSGSVWNTMPPHVHDRRMEVYFYFELNQGQAVCHFMGEPQQTQHIWVRNHQAVLSPPWSIHSGVGTSSYSFIWSMAGENLDYQDMDAIAIDELK